MTAGLYLRLKTSMAFSSKVDAGSREESASKIKLEPWF
jgi:hypothetical protein